MTRSEYILTRDSQNLDDAVEDAVEGTVGEQLVQVIQSDNPDESGMIRPFVVIDLRNALKKVRRSDATVPGIDEAAQAASDLAAEGESGTETDQQSSGRSRLPRLLVAGVVLGVGYALRNRRQSGSGSGTPSVNEAAEEAAGETQSIAEKAASAIQQRGEVAASRIEEGSDAIAERIEEKGEMTAEQLEETGEQLDEAESEAEQTVEDAKAEAEEKADEMSDADE